VLACWSQGILAAGELAIVFMKHSGLIEEYRDVLTAEHNRLLVSSGSCHPIRRGVGTRKPCFLVFLDNGHDSCSG
jgi:hypothetical protein